MSLPATATPPPCRKKWRAQERWEAEACACMQKHISRAHLLPSLVVVHVGVGQRCRAPDGESPAPLPTMSTRDVPAGRWMRAQGRFNRRAHPVSPVLVHVGVGQRCRAAIKDEESRSAPLPSTSAHTFILKRSFNREHTKRAQLRFERVLDEGSKKVQQARAHLASPILVHVGAGQRCRAIDGESTATLPQPCARNFPQRGRKV